MTNIKYTKIVIHLLSFLYKIVIELTRQVSLKKVNLVDYSKLLQYKIDIYSHSIFEPEDNTLISELIDVCFM